MAGLIDVGIGDLVKGLMPVVNRVIDLIPDPAAKQRAQLEMQSKLLEIATTESNNQAEINKIEASSTSLWVAGWRPAIGWVCATGFFWAYILQPIALWICALNHITPNFPLFDNNGLMELTLGMLGMGALRSFDKWKGRTK